MLTELYILKETLMSFKTENIIYFYFIINDWNVNILEMPYKFDKVKFIRHFILSFGLYKRILRYFNLFHSMA